MTQPSLFDPAEPEEPNNVFDIFADRPLPVRHNHPSTSHRAAEMARPRAGTMRWRVLVALAEAGQNGLNCYELSLALAYRRPWVLDTRRKELADGGHVEVTDMERPTDTGAMARVHRITAKGLRALEGSDEPT